MTEQISSKEPVGKPEILDFDKYHGLYARFYLASEAATEEQMVSIINPNEKVVLKNLKTDRVGHGNYNPVFQNFSLAERQEKWKDFKPSEEYQTPYIQWKKEFTRFMKTKIEEGSNRELALKTILPGKNPATFNEDDADDLFNKFCDGKSDVHEFTSMVLSNLERTGKMRNGKIDLEKLVELLPDLEWIASGLFGKETAKFVYHLIAFESLRLNTLNNVVLLVLYDEERINKLTDDERRVLGLLHDSFSVPQEKVPGPAQVTAAVPIVPDTSAAGLRSAPVSESDEDKKRRLGITPPPPPPSPTQERSGDTATRIQNLLSQLSTLEESPTNIGEHTKRYIDDQKKAINEQIKGLERIDELKIQIGNLEKIDTSKFGKYTIQNKSLQEEKLRKELANLQAKYPPPPEIVPKSEKEGLITAQPQPAEKPVETMTHEATEEIEAAARANSGSLPGQAEFDPNDSFTGTDDDFSNALASLESKYTNLRA